VALGAQRDTFMGLAGLGDLVLTCTDNQSRNRRFGMAVAKGKSPEEAMREIGQVVESVQTADEVMRQAEKHGIELPISQRCRPRRTARSPRRRLAELLAASRRPNFTTCSADLAVTRRVPGDAGFSVPQRWIETGATSDEARCMPATTSAHAKLAGAGLTSR
jgi:hypothetical protein